MAMNKLIFALAAALLLSACATVINISEELSPAELIQRAHEAMDKNRYNTAIQYYQALHERNRSNIDLMITAEYHIAFIHYKQKKYEQSRFEFNTLLAHYNTPDEELLPQHFKKLSQIVLNSIDEKEKQRRPFSRKKE